MAATRQEAGEGTMDQKRTGWRSHSMGAHAALLLLTGLAGCAAADLPAVTATGAAGERLRYDDPVLSAAPALCLEVASLSGANDDCAALRPEARAWSRVATLLEAYAAALARAARHHARGEGLLSPGVAGGSWTGLKPEDAAAATALANATRVLETDSDVIKRAITDADAPIQVLAKDLDAILERRVANIDLAGSRCGASTARVSASGSSGRPVEAREGRQGRLRRHHRAYRRGDRRSPRGAA